MLRDIRPVGEPITLRQNSEWRRDAFGGYEAHFYGSGTMALAAAFMAAKRMRPVSSPEVILPGYGCPSLLSAALYAGIQPVLADIESDVPRLRLESVAQRVSPRTVAIVGVHLLGIRERSDALMRLAQRMGCFFVEDSAQMIPRRGQDPWRGHFVILSFGRGKPVSLLSGGAVLMRSDGDPNALPRVSKRVGGRKALVARAMVHNIFMRTPFYGVVRRIPGVNLGKTVFRPLDRIDGLDEATIAAANEAVMHYRTKTGRPLRLPDFERLSGIVDVARRSGAAAHALLRYPLLLPDDTLCRDVHRALDRAGLGASRLYGTTLDKIEGIPDVGFPAEIPNARRFGARLLTLPIHSAVRKEHLMQIDRTLSRFLPEQATASCGRVRSLPPRFGSGCSRHE